MPIVLSPFADLIALSDAKAHLNIPTADTSHDAEIQTFIDAATALIENVVGNVTGTTYIERYNGGGERLTLNHVPVLSVSSVVENFGSSTSYTLTAAANPYDVSAGAYAYWLELNTGLMTRVWSGFPGPFAGGLRSVAVTYTAGRTSTPANVLMAAKEAVREMYQQTQLGGRPSFNNSTAEDVPALSSPFALSYRVLEYLMPHRTNFGIG